MDVEDDGSTFKNVAKKDDHSNENDSENRQSSWIFKNAPHRKRGQIRTEVVSNRVGGGDGADDYQPPPFLSWIWGSRGLGMT